MQLTNSKSNVKLQSKSMSKMTFKNYDSFMHGSEEDSHVNKNHSTLSFNTSSFIYDILKTELRNNGF